MITIMKTYNRPMLQVVSIKKNDIVTASPFSYDNAWDGKGTLLAPGQRGLDDYYEEY